jgi:hypothetical protein
VSNEVAWFAADLAPTATFSYRFFSGGRPVKNLPIFGNRLPVKKIKGSDFIISLSAPGLKSG